MRLKELKDILEKDDTMIGLPEWGINVYLTEETLKLYGEREVDKIYIDRADDDLIVDLKYIKLKDYNLVGSHFPKKVYAIDFKATWELDDEVLEIYGNKTIEEVFVMTDDGDKGYVSLGIYALK